MKLYSWDEMCRTPGVYRAALDERGNYSKPNYDYSTFVVEHQCIQHVTGELQSIIAAGWRDCKYVRVRKYGTLTALYEEVQNPTPYDDGTVDWAYVQTHRGTYLSPDSGGVIVNLDGKKAWFSITTGAFIEPRYTERDRFKQVSPVVGPSFIAEACKKL